MYKNFNITESEKEQILNRLKENGYGQPINEQNTNIGTPPPKGGTPPPQRGPKLPVNPKLTLIQNIQNMERAMGRQLTQQEVKKLTFDLNQLKKTPKRTTTPTVDNNDLAGIDKGEGLNLYHDEAQKELRYSATIDKIVKSGSGFDVFVSGDYNFRDTYYHWEPNAPYFQAFVKSTHKPLTWSYSGKTYTEKVYNKEFSSVLQQKVPTPQPNNGIDFVSGNVNEQNAVDFAPVAGPTNYGTAVDKMNIIKEKIMGQPVRFFMDTELKTPAYNGANFTFSKVEKDKSISTRFKIYFKEFKDPLNFECGTFKDAFFRPYKSEFLYNATLYKYLTTALCNTTMSDDGKTKSVPNVKYVKNNTQGSPNQTDNQTLAENKKIKNQKTNNMKVRKIVRLTESELKRYINKVVSEQINPDYSKGTHDMDKRGDTYLPLAQKLAKQLKDMKFKFNGKNIFTNTFDGYKVTVEFNNHGVYVTKVPEKQPLFTDDKGNTHGMGLPPQPLKLPFEKLTEMNFMKQVVDYVHGTKS